MTDRPILFSAPMIRALLYGRKTQTRRVAKIAAITGDKVAITSPNESLIELEPGEFRNGVFHYESSGGLSGPYHLPYAVGDRLWVREAWQAHSWASDCVTIRYRAQERTVGFTKQVEQIAYPEGGKNAFKYVSPKGPNFWRPSIHMPRWASRLTLTVTDVRVQREQEISEADSIAEGCRPFFDHENPEITYGPNGTEHRMAPLRGPVDDFRQLWDSLNAKRGFGWSENPWIAAYTFTVHRCNIDQMESANG